jgi:YhhN-like protein.
MDFFNLKLFIASEEIKYLCILLCFLISIIAGKNCLNSNDIMLLRLGIFFTTLADFCLLFLNHFIIGICIFSIVQSLYIVRYRKAHYKIFIENLAVFFLLLLTSFFIINCFIIKIDFLFVIAIFYAFCLLNSFFSAFLAFKKKLFPNPNRYMIFIGMLLFLFCDINVAIFNITSLMSASQNNANLINSVSGFLMWFFYLPSQLLLSLSGYNYN